MKAVVAAFNQEKALVGAFSVIVKLRRLIANSSSGKGDSEAAAGCTCAAVYPVAAPPAPHFLLVGNYLVFIPSVIVLPSY